MKNNLFKKALAGVLAGALSIATFTNVISVTSYAEESEEAVTKSFTIDELVCNTALGSTSPDLGSEANVTFELSSDSVVKVSDIAPEYDGYHIERADYRKGYSNYVGVDYFYLNPYTVAATGERAYSVYFHYTGASGTSNLKQAASHTKGTHLFVHYALNNYVVTYSAEGAENIPIDKNVYTVKDADGIVVSSEVPKKEGYSFNGWILDETGGIYAPGDKIALKDIKKEAVNFNASFSELPKAGVEVTTEEVASWEDKVQLNITVTNSSDLVVNNWKVALGFGGTIDQIWNAEIVSKEQGEYVIGHPSWKSDLAAGESYTFGVIATRDSAESIFIEDSALVSKELEADPSSYEVAFSKSEWSYGYNGEITVANTSDDVLEGWKVEFDLADEITGIWNANIVSHEGQHYLIENAGYNDAIATHSGVSFGFSAIPENEAEYSNASLENVSLTIVK